MHPQTFKLSLLVWAMNIFNIEKLAESKALILIHNTRIKMSWVVF